MSLNLATRYGLSNTGSPFYGAGQLGHVSLFPATTQGGQHRDVVLQAEHRRLPVRRLKLGWGGVRWGGVGVGVVRASAAQAGLAGGGGCSIDSGQLDMPLDTWIACPTLARLAGLRRVRVAGFELQLAPTGPGLSRPQATPLDRRPGRRARSTWWWCWWSRGGRWWSTGRRGWSTGCRWWSRGRCRRGGPRGGGASGTRRTCRACQRQGAARVGGRLERLAGVTDLVAQQPHPAHHLVATVVRVPEAPRHHRRP